MLAHACTGRLGSTMQMPPSDMKVSPAVATPSVDGKLLLRLPFWHGLAQASSYGHAHDLQLAVLLLTP